MYSTNTSIHSFAHQYTSMFSNIILNSITSTSNSITVNYTTPVINGNLLSGYKLEVSYNTNKFTNQDVSSVFILSVSNLQPLTLYNVKLSGIYNNQITNSLNRQYGTLLDPPSNISIGVITKNSVSINYTSPSSNGNTITYITNQGSLTGNSSPFIISGLSPNTNYTSITVKSSAYYTGTTTIGYSIPINIPSFTTLVQPQIITSVTPTQTTYNSILYNVYTFKSTSLTTMQFILATPIIMHIFMVGGGGSAGKSWTYVKDGVEVIPGGGGAGGVFQTNLSGITLSSSTTFNITIGSGGINLNAADDGTPNNGTNTIFTNSIIKYTAGGGGYGGGYYHSPSSGTGGSSGGWNRTSNNNLSGSVPYPSQISFQTNADTSNNLHYSGGTAYSGSSTAAGGGGAGGNGSNGLNPGGNGAGGPGITPSNPIFGTDTFACGGYGYGTAPVNNVNDALNSGNGGGRQYSPHLYINTINQRSSGFKGICKIAVKASDFS